MSAKNRLLLFSIFLSFSIAMLNGCSCNCGKSSAENLIKGYITVVGNEPFTELAVKTAEGKIYLLQCSKEMHDDLWKKQGNHYFIQYTDLKEKEGGTAIVVEKIIPVTKDDK